MKMRERFRQWVATARRRVLGGPPLVGLETLTIVADDLRKLGLGALGAGVVGFFVPAAGSAPGTFIALAYLGAIIWLTGIAMHAHVERARSTKKD